MRLCNLKIELRLLSDKSSKKIAPKAPTRRTGPVTHLEDGLGGSVDIPSVQKPQKEPVDLERSSSQNATTSAEPSKTRLANSTASRESHLRDVGTCTTKGTLGEVIQRQEQELYRNLEHESNEATPSRDSSTASETRLTRERDASTEPTHPLLPSELSREGRQVSAQIEDRAQAINALVSTAERPAKRRRIQERLDAVSSQPLPAETAQAIPNKRRSSIARQGTQLPVGSAQNTIPSTISGDNADGSPHNAKIISKPWPGRSQKNSEGLNSTPIDPVISTSNIVPGQNAQSTVPAGGKKISSRRRARLTAEDAAAAVVADVTQSSPNRRRKRSGRKRQETPEGAEAVQIESSAVKMVDLCKDSGTGKRSLREKEFKELDEKAKCAKRQGPNATEKDVHQDSSSQREPYQQNREDQDPENGLRPLHTVLTSDDLMQGAGTREARAGRAIDKEHDTFDHGPESAHLHPATRIVNGEIVLDESSLRIDRRANAIGVQIGQALEAVEESELTRQVTAGSWLKRDKSGSWNVELTELLYEGLRMFGTDFGMISKMFAGKSRHAIKRKFCLEERLSPARVEATLRGERLEVDLDQFSHRTNTVYEDPQELENEIAEDRQKLEDEQAREKQAMEEARKKRAEEAAAESAVAGRDSSGKENRRRKRRNREDVKFIEGEVQRSVRAPKKPESCQNK